MWSILAVVLLQMASAPPTHVNKKVEVKGKTYRVFVRGPEVKVFNKSPIASIASGRSVERRHDMREAVHVATGCLMKDDFWRNGILVGELACPQAPPD